MKPMTNPEDGSECYLIHARTRERRECPAETARLIVDRRDVRALKCELEEWRQQRWHLVWFCGHEHHVVKNQDTIGLRVNPRHSKPVSEQAPNVQEHDLPSAPQAESCIVCGCRLQNRPGKAEVRGPRVADPTAGAAPYSSEGPIRTNASLGVKTPAIAKKRLWEGESAFELAPVRPFVSGNPSPRVSGHSSRPRNATRQPRSWVVRSKELGEVANLMHHANLSNYWPGREERDDWPRLYSVLRNTDYLGHLSWMPGGKYPGFLGGMIKRMRAHCERTGRRDEGWIIQTIDDVVEGTESVTIGVRSLAYTRELLIRKDGGDIYDPFFFDIPHHLIVRPSIFGTPVSGPSLAVISCFLENGRLVPVRAAIRPILSRTHILSVDSALERTPQEFLIKHGIPFDRPLVKDRFGLVPDVIIHRYRIIVEVNGFPGAQYERRKDVLVTLLEQHYPGYMILCWRENRGESFADFQPRLQAALTSRGCRVDWQRSGVPQLGQARSERETPRWDQNHQAVDRRGSHPAS